jgi:hypothetical protein
MWDCLHRPGRGGRRRRPSLPEPGPFGANHAAVIGTLCEDARPGRNPVGDAVTVLPIEFPVVDPEHPQVLWTWARFDVEIPVDLARHFEVQSLTGGTPIFAAGQLSERWVIENGRSSRRGVIVADLVQGDAAGALLAPQGRRP